MYLQDVSFKYPHDFILSMSFDQKKLSKLFCLVLDLVIS